MYRDGQPVLSPPRTPSAGSGVRALQRTDLPAVASLYERLHRSGSRVPAPGLAALFDRTLLGSPWSTSDIPSLVYERDGRLLGFIGVHVRRMRFGGDVVRVAVLAQLMSDPDARGMPAGALLLRAALSGAQDATLSAAGPEVARMWDRLGARTLTVSSVGWMRVLRPAGLLGSLAFERAGRQALLGRARPVLSLVDRLLARPAHAFASQWAGPGQVVVDERARADGVRAEPLTPGHVVEHLPSLAAPASVHPEYDIAFLSWLFCELEAVTARGDLVRRLIRAGDGRAIGWYVAYMHPTGISRVLQVVAREGDAGVVLDELFAEARRRGTPAVVGRVSPRLTRALWERPCQLLRETRHLVHASRPELLDALLRGDGLITGLEGEEWMGHHLDPLP